MEVTKGITAGAVVALNPLTLISENEKRELFGVDGKSAGKKDWVGFAKAKDAEVAAGGADRAGQGRTCRGREGRRAGNRQGRRPGQGQGQGPDQGCRWRWVRRTVRSQVPEHPPEDRQKIRTASPEERNEILKRAGFTDDEREQMRQMREQRGGGGGGFGGGPPRRRWARPRRRR